MRKAVILALGFALTAALAPHGATAACGYTDLPHVSKTLKNANGTVDAVDPGKVDEYSVSLGAGEHYVALVTVGDGDMSVCKSGTLVCHSENPVAPDGCLAEDLEGNPGIGNFLVGPGTFKFQIRHCFGTVCGYPADPGAPVAYALVIV
jgi:hypothetical protein